MKTRRSDPLVLPPPRHPERTSVSSHQLLFCGTILLDVCVVVWVVTQVEADLDPAERLYPTWQSCSPSGSFHNNNGGWGECQAGCHHCIYYFLIRSVTLFEFVSGGLIRGRQSADC